MGSSLCNQKWFQSLKLCKQAELTILCIDEEFFRVPDNNAVDEFALVDFHHVNGHFTSDQFHPFQPNQEPIAQPISAQGPLFPFYEVAPN